MMHNDNSVNIHEYSKCGNKIFIVSCHYDQYIFKRRNRIAHLTFNLDHDFGFPQLNEHDQGTFKMSGGQLNEKKSKSSTP